MRKREGTGPKPPACIGREAVDFWRKLQAAYHVEDAAGLALLEQATRAYHTLRLAERQLEAEGLVIDGPRGMARAHPAAAVARDARSGVLQALKALNFAPPEDVR